MRLTNLQKNEFVERAMADVPRDKLNAIRAEVERLALDDALSKVPDAIKQIWADPDLNKWIKRSAIVLPGSLTNMYDSYPSITNAWYEPSEAVWAQLVELEKQHRAEAERINELESKLRGVVAACTTRAALLKALPEFEKYLPPEASPDRSVPVISNLVASFVEAGWPKS